ncbi:MAG: hypothetical protein LQ337_003656 [Flavoplaca oasis]|nr:MAG: hypothetical protein LQ337_003656 [Flavoplaca oasis]
MSDSSSSSPSLFIDWRTAPKVAEMMTELQRFIVKIDAEVLVGLRPEHTTAENNVTLGIVDGVAILRRSDAFAGRHEKLDVVKRKVNDIALTLGIHPAAFGVQQQAGGTISTNGFTLENTVVTNLFEWENRPRSQPKMLSGTDKKKLRGKDVAILPLVLDTRIILQKDSRLDAVIVTEHRNLSTLDIGNVLLVMTGGYPTSTTKEYLNMLSNHPKLQQVPFLCFIDHDMGGFSIFQTLKYGSKNQAWGSKNMVCPRLEYAGPTRQDLRDSVRRYRPQWVDQYKINHPSDTDAQVGERAAKWAKSMRTKIGGKFSKHTAKDLEKFRSFEKLGWLELEPAVKREVNLTIGAKIAGKFRTAALTTVSLDYPRIFIETKLRQKCPNRGAVSFPAPAARGDYLQNTPSQPPSVPHGTGSSVNIPGAEMDVDLVETMAPDRALTNSPDTELRLLSAMDVP